MKDTTHVCSTSSQIHPTKFLATQRHKNNNIHLKMNTDKVNIFLKFQSPTVDVVRDTSAALDGNKSGNWKAKMRKDTHMKVRMANRRSPELFNFELTSGYRNIDVRKTLIYLCKKKI